MNLKKKKNVNFKFPFLTDDSLKVGPAEVSDAEDQYGALDALVMLTAPAAVIRRQLERVSSIEAGQSPSSSVSSASEGMVAGQGAPRDGGDYALLMKKRAVRNIFQPNKVSPAYIDPLSFLSVVSSASAVPFSFLSLFLLGGETFTESLSPFAVRGRLRIRSGHQAEPLVAELGPTPRRNGRQCRRTGPRRSILQKAATGPLSDLIRSVRQQKSLLNVLD